MIAALRGARGDDTSPRRGVRGVDAIALAGFNPLGQVLVQFMIVWQRYSLKGSSSSSRRSPVASSRLSMIQR
ncbi:MAG: hypothetical protein ABS73_03425 [Paracoccus sp. SCN 68-21]|nr:MAG: hypothetical protein ABS73_03425 [Paracoccus sp. SCN 68-21]